MENAAKNGVETEKEVNATQINGVRVRFIPEVERSYSNQIVTRSMVNTRVVWEEWGKASTSTGGNSSGSGSDSGNGGTSDGSGDDGQDKNPLG